MGRRTIKIWIYILSGILCIVFLFCAKKIVSKTQDNLTEVVEEKCEKIDFESAHQLLNQNLFENNLAQWFDDIFEQEIFLYSEKVKGEFVEVQNADSNFPEELISRMEKMLYQSLDSTLHKITLEETKKIIY